MADAQTRGRQDASSVEDRPGEAHADKSLATGGVIRIEAASGQTHLIASLDGSIRGALGDGRLVVFLIAHHFGLGGVVVVIVATGGGALIRLTHVDRRSRTDGGRFLIAGTALKLQRALSVGGDEGGPRTGGAIQTHRGGGGGRQLAPGHRGRILVGIDDGGPQRDRLARGHGLVVRDVDRRRLVLDHATAFEPDLGQNGVGVVVDGSRIGGIDAQAHPRDQRQTQVAGQQLPAQDCQRGLGAVTAHAKNPQCPGVDDRKGRLRIEPIDFTGAGQKARVDPVPDPKRDRVGLFQDDRLVVTARLPCWDSPPSSGMRRHDREHSIRGHHQDDRPRLIRIHQRPHRPQ